MPAEEHWRNQELINGMRFLATVLKGAMFTFNSKDDVINCTLCSMFRFMKLMQRSNGRQFECSWPFNRLWVHLHWPLPSLEDTEFWTSMSSWPTRLCEVKANINKVPAFYQILSIWDENLQHMTQDMFIRYQPANPVSRPGKWPTSCRKVRQGKPREHSSKQRWLFWP